MTWPQRLQQTRRLPKRIQLSGGSLMARGLTQQPQQPQVAAKKPLAGWTLSFRYGHETAVQSGFSCHDNFIIGVATLTALHNRNSRYLLFWPRFCTAIFCLLFDFWPIESVDTGRQLAESCKLRT